MKAYLKNDNNKCWHLVDENGDSIDNLFVSETNIKMKVGTPVVVEIKLIVPTYHDDHLLSRFEFDHKNNK